jgi:hypothetical protein
LAAATAAGPGSDRDDPPRGRTGVLGAAACQRGARLPANVVVVIGAAPAG